MQLFHRFRPRRSSLAAPAQQGARGGRLRQMDYPGVAGHRSPPSGRSWRRTSELTAATMLPALSRMPETPRPHAARSSGTGNSRGSLSGHGHANVRRIDLVALALLTAAGFALRLVGMDSSLFGDERYTYSIVDGHGLGTVWHDVFTTSITPPLHYALAWVSLQWGGDSTVLVRLPSLVLGTAAIPVVFLLGRRVAGTRVGLFAAAILALSPFAIFYSTEARAYATMVFLVGLSTLALLEAVGRGRTAWWVIYTLSSCAAIWAHYTAAFVLATQALWAVLARPDRWRTVAVAQVVIALGYLPWLPGFLEQRRNRGVEAFDSLTTFDVSSVAEYPIRWVVGHPFRELDAIPGRTGLVLMLAVLLTATFAAAVTVRQGSGLPRAAAALRSERGLMVLLSAATLLGLLHVRRRRSTAVRPAQRQRLAAGAGRRAGAGAGRRDPPAAGRAAPCRNGPDAVTACRDGRPERRQREPASRVPGCSQLHRCCRRYRCHRRGAARVRPRCATRPVHPQPVPPEVASPCRGRTGRRRVATRAGWRLGHRGEPPAVRRHGRRGQGGVSCATGADEPSGRPGRAFPRRSTKTFPGFYPLTVERFRGAVDGHLGGPRNAQVISWSLGRRAWLLCPARREAP